MLGIMKHRTTGDIWSLYPQPAKYVIDFVEPRSR